MIYDDKEIERAILCNPLKNLIEEYVSEAGGFENIEFDEMMHDLYDTDEFHEAVQTSMRWTYDYMKKFETA